MPSSSIMFQSLNTKDLPAFRELLKYSFILKNEQVENWVPDDFPLEWIVAGYEGDHLVTSTIIFPRDLAGPRGMESTGCVSGVATDPNARGSGLAKKLMKACLERMRKDGVRWSLLYPFDFEFYARLGWGQGSPCSRISFPPSLLDLRRAPGGSFRFVEFKEWEVLSRIHREWVHAGPGALLRFDRIWGYLINRPLTPRHAVVWISPDGASEGYLIYELNRKVLDTRDGSVMNIVDWAWKTPEARRALEGYIAHHRGQLGIVNILLPPDDPLTNIEGESVAKRTVRGPMGRIVDVDAYFSESQRVENGGVVIQIIDPVCGWNNGLFRLVLQGDSIDGFRVEDAQPDIVLDIESLSAFLWGSLSAGTILATESLRGDAPQRLCSIESGVPRKPPFFHDWF